MGFNSVVFVLLGLLLVALSWQTPLETQSMSTSNVSGMKASKMPLQSVPLMVAHISSTGVLISGRPKNAFTTHRIKKGRYVIRFDAFPNWSARGSPTAVVSVLQSSVLRTRVPYTAIVVLQTKRMVQYLVLDLNQQTVNAVDSDCNVIIAWS